MAKPTPQTPEEIAARGYADRLVLLKLTEIGEAIKPSEIADLLTAEGIGLGVVRSLLASNPEKFAYNERRWVPASRIESEGRPFNDILYTVIHRFGGPMGISLLVQEIGRTRTQDEGYLEQAVIRAAQTDDRFFLTRSGQVGIDAFVFKAGDEKTDRAIALNSLTREEVEEARKAVGVDFDWRATDSIIKALEKTAPISVKALGAAAWMSLNPQDPKMALLFNWKSFNGELLSVPGFIYSADGKMHLEADAKKWISAAVRIADRLAPTIEIEDATPLELKKDDIEAALKRIIGANETVTATFILENQFEVTPSIKTFPDDLANLMAALKNDPRVWWVGGDRFRRPGEAPDFIETIPEPFEFVQTAFLQDDGDPVDLELTDDGLSSTLRKLIVHPLATDVQDEEILPAPKNMPEQLRLVLKPIHRELGTFPLCQFPTGWFETDPPIQELLLINPDGEELQAWVNHKARLIFNLFDWWLDQSVESGAVFSLTKTTKPNVLEFAWLDQTDPVVYVSSQRMDELREIAHRAEELSTFDVLREVMVHWPKGADFLTLLWEVNVVRRTSRRLLASLLSSYVCFYQRSGSPVWHYDHKKVEQGFDKSKKKFIKKD